jgi:hypothetical protein
MSHKWVEDGIKRWGNEVVRIGHHNYYVFRKWARKIMALEDAGDAREYGYFARVVHKSDQLHVAGTKKPAWVVLVRERK